MIKLVFEENYKTILHEANLKSLQDFFDFSNGELINRNQKRNVVAFTLNVDNQPVEFFMKRFVDPHLKDMFFVFRNYHHFHSQAAAECKSVEILAQHGIKAYKPVCCGEERFCGFEKRSLFITEKINGPCLTDFITHNWKNLALQQKQKLITSLATWIRKIHDANISLPDLYIWHIFLVHGHHTNQNDYDFAVIDLHRMRVNVKLQKHRIKDLGAFDFSLNPEHFDPDIKNIFLKAYLPDASTRERLKLQKKIKKRSQKLERKRKRLDY